MVQNLANRFPASDNSFVDYINDMDQSNSFFYAPATTAELEKDINSLPSNKSYGLYSCPIQFLKTSKHVLSEHLAKLINLSVQMGKYPTKLKIAKIILVSKEDDNSEPNNYRPISLLSIINRLFENIIYNKLIDFIEKHGLHSNSQYGFRKHHATHAILDIMNQIHFNLDNKLYTCAVFLDLKKAFDTVNHNILLKKLSFYGIRGCMQDWFASYLCNRSQSTSITTYVSDRIKISCGVPQGSILGPLLFLIYINDLSTYSNMLRFHLFADDTNILYANKCPKKT